MNVGTDTLKTIAILDDSPYLAGVERMAAATHALGHTSGSDRLAGGMTLAGGLMVGLGAKAIETASHFQQMQMSLKRLSGSDDLFNSLKKFTLQTPYTTSIWADQARMLLGFGVAADQVIPTMKRLGDAVTGAYGIDEGRLKQLTLAYADMAKGFANARHVRMFQTAGVTPYASIEKYLGLSEEQIANIGKMHIPGRYVNAAIMTGIQDDPTKQGAMEQHLHTLEGATHKLSEAWQLFMYQAGSGSLEPVTKAVRWLADEVARLSDPGASKSLGYLILYGGPAMLAGGPLIKAISLWKQMEGAKKLATIASNTERNAELAKLPVLTAESDAVSVATARWTKLGSSLLTVAARAGTLYAAYTALIGVKDIYDYTQPLGPEKGAYNAEFNNLRKDRGGALADFAKDPINNLTVGIVDTFRGQGTAREQFTAMTEHAFALIKASKDEKAMADFQRLLPGMKDSYQHWSKTPWSTVENQTGKLHEIVNESQNYTPLDAAMAAQDKAATAYNKKMLDEYHANSYKYLKEKTAKKKKPLGASAAADPLDQADIAEDRAETMMKIAGLRYKRTGAKADHDAYNASRKATLGLIDGEIAGLERHAAAIEHVAGKAREWLSTEKKVQSLMEKHEELESDKLDKDKRDKLDKHIATLLGAGGLGEDEFLKRTGINGRFLSQLGKHKAPVNPMIQALKALAKQPLVLNLHLGDKPFAQIKSEIENSTVAKLIQVLEGSNSRTLYGGH